MAWDVSIAVAEALVLPSLPHLGCPKNCNPAV